MQCQNTNWVTDYWRVATEELPWLSLNPACDCFLCKKMGTFNERTKPRLFYSSYHLHFTSITEMQETKGAETLISWRWEMAGKQQRKTCLQFEVIFHLGFRGLLMVSLILSSASDTTAHAGSMHKLVTQKQQTQFL